MNKEKLLNDLINEFIKDKEDIKENLLSFMDLIIIEAKGLEDKFTLTIKYEKVKNNDSIFKN